MASVDVRLKEIQAISDWKTARQKLLKLHDETAQSGDLAGYPCLLEDLEQIVSARTGERGRYYLDRLVRAFESQKTSSHNDLNLYRWKEYSDILTDSFWDFRKRDQTGIHQAGYWGNFIPQIPHQLIRRYTKEGDWVFDPFLGSGTTLIECMRLGRNGVGVELQEKVAKLTREALTKADNPQDVKAVVHRADSTTVDLTQVMQENGIEKFQFAVMHPPYWDIIHFSKDKRDLSNAPTLEDFLEKMGEVVDRLTPHLERGRYLALVIGDKYARGEWMPLAFYTMQEVLKRHYRLKSIIVKNFEDTRGKRSQQELWRYRALAGGFYIFKHEYIFLFQKKGK